MLQGRLALSEQCISVSAAGNTFGMLTSRFFPSPLCLSLIFPGVTQWDNHGHPFPKGWSFLIDSTSSLFENRCYLPLGLCCLRKFHLSMQAGLGVWTDAHTCKTCQCRTMADITCEEVGNGVPVCLACVVLLGHSLTKEPNSWNVTEEYMVWVAFLWEARISLHLLFFCFKL